MKNELLGYSKADLDSLKRVESIQSRHMEIVGALSMSVFGQDEACHATARMVVRYEAGLTRGRPAGVLLFMGPNSTGKTETGLALADYKKCNKKVINCSEFTSEASLTRILGGSPNWVGYGDETLITKSLLSEENVLIFDEIEKADPQLWKTLLSVMESGKLNVRVATSKGHAVEEELDFGKSHIIFTSNVKNLKQYFKEIPEFLARIDEVITFKELDVASYEKIYWKFIKEINDYLGEEVLFTTTDGLASYLVWLGCQSNEYGARDIRHVVDAYLVGPLSDILLSNPNLRSIVADITKDGIQFYDLSSGNTGHVSESLGSNSENPENYPLLDGRSFKPYVGIEHDLRGVVYVSRITNSFKIMRKRLMDDAGIDVDKFLKDVEIQTNIELVGKNLDVRFFDSKSFHDLKDLRIMAQSQECQLLMNGIKEMRGKHYGAWMDEKGRGHCALLAIVDKGQEGANGPIKIGFVYFFKDNYKDSVTALCHLDPKLPVGLEDSVVQKALKFMQKEWKLVTVSRVITR